MGGNIQVREGGRGRGQALEHGLRVPAIESGGGSQLWASALACVLSFLVVVLVCCLYCCMRATQARRKSGAGMLLTEFPARKCFDPFLRRTDHTHDDESLLLHNLELHWRLRVASHLGVCVQNRRGSLRAVSHSPPVSIF